MKPILFNTESVRAILDGRKTVTRRVVRRKELDDVLSSPCRIKNPDIPDGRFINCLCTAPCEAGDILWVRETWAAWSPTYGVAPKLYCKADGDAPAGIKWRPSIYMPKEAARLFLRVKEVSVERLREISALSAMDEGVTDWNDFVRLWNTTIKPANLPLYGWEANPWVWVIEFERCEKPEGWPK